MGETKKGYYIILEGGEGCGKDEQAKLLLEYFQKKGYPSMITREPGGTPEAEQIRKILLHSKGNISTQGEFFLFEAGRELNYDGVVKPNRKKGITTIKTRSWLSTTTYQGYAGGMDLEEIKKANYIATGGIMPDLAIILNIEAKLGLEKEVNPDRFAAKGLDYHMKVNEGYLEIAKQHPEFTVVVPYRDGDMMGMQEEIREHIRTRLNL